MEYTTLGRTGLRVSVAGLGGGGHSRLGQATDKSRADSRRVLDAAFDMGVNFFDTARTYGTEDLIGEAVKGRRDRVVLSTKSHIAHHPFEPEKFQFLEPWELEARVEESLRNLGTDYIDIFHIHGVEAHYYRECVERAAPVLDQLRDQGKIRFFGITERFIEDTGHAMLEEAVGDDVWDVMMVGFNLLNPSARWKILNITREKGIGTLAMFAVRRALSRPETLTEGLQPAIAAAQITPEALDDAPLAFLTEECGAASLPEAAYRFCRHEPGIDVVLTGTGNVDHLHQNLAAITTGPLPDHCLARLDTLFGRVDTVSGN